MFCDALRYKDNYRDPIPVVDGLKARIRGLEDDIRSLKDEIRNLRDEARSLKDALANAPVPPGNQSINSVHARF